MSGNQKLSRRGVLKQALRATAAGMSLPAIISCAEPTTPTPPTPPTPSRETETAQTKAPGPNDQVGIGIIGCGRRCHQLVTGVGGQGRLPDYARIVAVSDFNMLRAKQWGAKYNCPSYQEYRKVLDREDVDVVIYATPEHWHYLPCIHAAQAGKDMYGEQPLSHTIREGRVMADAVRKHKCVFQTGEQQRSHPLTRKAVELVLNGRIGKVHTVIGYNYPSPYECNFPAQPIPDGLDWDRWCGPNPVVPYHTDLYLSRVAYVRRGYRARPAEKYAVGPGWMSFRPYSGGELANWGCHGLSMVQWALGMDESGAVEVWVERGEKLPTVVYDTPETRDRGDALCSKSIIHYRFANGVVLKLSGTDPRVGGGGTFIGDKGKITIFREGYECDPVGLDEDPLPSGAIRVYRNDQHMGNFFRCVKSRKDPIMNIENGHRVATLCHLGNIARWLGRSLKWDPEKEIFPGDDEANTYLDIERRKDYELPDV